MILRFYVPLFSLTLLLSAVLLFSVQPMFSKMVLPLLGGTPNVWNTSMLFFQVVLLAGYAYAHGTTRFLNVRLQGVLHLILLGIFAVVLPLGIPDGTRPPTTGNPSFWQLGLMAMSVGGPFFILAASAPMLQRWFAATKHKDADNPYFLYGASNLGSMSALLAYPFIIEPVLTLDGQSLSWSYGYGVLAILFAISYFSVFKGAASAQKSAAKKDEKLDEVITWPRRLRWILLAFIPSSMMLGVTTYITTDIASAPLLWILPLALYVGTFIVVFSRKEIVDKNLVSIVFLILVSVMFLSFSGWASSPLITIGFHLSIFLSAALLCHKELADARPSARYLTEFYLLMSFGGALGGFFNAIIAPNVFVHAIEYPLMIALTFFVRMSSDDSYNLKSLSTYFKDIFENKTFTKFLDGSSLNVLVILFCAITVFVVGKSVTAIILNFVIFICLINLITTRWAAAFCASLLLFLFPPGHAWELKSAEILHESRNFFGILRVVDDFSLNERFLLHGTTNHGTQSLNPSYNLEPLSYYSHNSPIRGIYNLIEDNPLPQKVAIAGLGIGVTACFQKDGREYDFFEIDPDVVRIAENREFFTFLSDCGSPYEITLGDARLTLAEETDGKYDMILLDAFSSDSIPIHLITREAIVMYLKKLKNNDGILVFNVTNRHVDLEPLLHATAKELGIYSYGHATTGGKLDGTDIAYYPAHFVALTPNSNHGEFLKIQGWGDTWERQRIRVWTDQYSDLVRVFGNKNSVKRFTEYHERVEAEKAEAQSDDSTSKN